jgi:hypothetical protein
VVTPLNPKEKQDNAFDAGLLNQIAMKPQISSNSVSTALSSKGQFLFVLLGVWTLLAQNRGRAQGTFYTDRSIFNAALQSSTTIAFTGLPDPPPGIGRSPITISGVTFTNQEARLFTGSGYLWNFDSSYPVGVFLPNGKNAFAADFSGGIRPQNNPFDGTLTFTLLDGQVFTHIFTGQDGSWTFLGFAFSQPIRNLVYSDGGPFLPGAHEERLDNVTFGVVVPEPQTSLLAVLGMLASFGVRRLRKQR